MVLKNSPSLQNCLYSTSFIQLPFLYTSYPSDLANQLCTLRRRLSQREAEKRNARMSVLRTSHCSLKNLKNKKTNTSQKTGKIWVFVFNSCNFETRGSLYNYRISIHCPTSGKFGLPECTIIFPRCPHHWSQFPNTTTKLDGRCTQEIAKTHKTWGKSYNPIPSMRLV